MTGVLVVFFILAVLVLIIIAKTAIVVPQQSAYVVERLGRYQRHARRRLPRAAAVRRHDPLPTLAEGDCRRHSGTGLHHPRQRPGRRRRRAVSQGAEPGARLVRHLRTTCSPSASWRRPRCAARSARSIWTRRSKSERTSTPRSSASWTRRRKRGASRCCATRSRTSRRRTTCWRRWRSRCAPSARSAR